MVRLADAVRSKFPTDAPRRVGIMTAHGVGQIAAMLAVLASGAAYVPVEPSFPPGRIGSIFSDAEVDFVIADADNASRAAGFPTLVLPAVIDPADADNAPAPRIAAPADPAYILYTSGTTGKPKGVIVTNANVCHYARAFEDEFRIGAGDVMLQQSVCTFDIFVEEVFASLLNGAAIAIMPERARGHVNALIDYAERAGVTIISGFPYLVLDLNRLGRLPSRLRLLISGGDVLRPEFIDIIKGRVEIYNTYGPSETTVCATYQRCDNIDAAGGQFPIGHAVKGVRVAVLDDELRPVAPGETGEICIMGDGIAAGYVGNPPESCNFTTMPDGTRVYRSGDLGYVGKDGLLYFRQRKDRQVMIEGRRVECGEVETVLCESPDIERGVVCPFTDGKGMPYLVAFFVAKSRKVSLSAIRQHMKRLLAWFMIPEFFIEMQALPLTANGKVDFKALPHILKEGSL